MLLFIQYNDSSSPAFILLDAKRANLGYLFELSPFVYTNRLRRLASSLGTFLINRDTFP